MLDPTSEPKKHSSRSWMRHSSSCEHMKIRSARWETPRLSRDLCPSDLKPLRLVQLYGGSPLLQVLLQLAELHFPCFIQHFLLAVHAAADVEVRGVSQAARAELLQVRQLEQRGVIRGQIRIGPMQDQRLLLPVLLEEYYKLLLLIYCRGYFRDGSFSTGSYLTRMINFKTFEK